MPQVFKVFETNGSISILPKGTARPVITNDLIHLDTSNTKPTTYLIIDGRIDNSALNELGKTISWLNEKCKIKSKKDLKNILLAEYVDSKSNVILHLKKQPKQSTMQQ